jgi:hypothetical protein
VLYLLRQLTLQPTPQSKVHDEHCPQQRKPARDKGSKYSQDSTQGGAFLFLIDVGPKQSDVD